jgi:Bacterial Ig-like domain (group 3)
MLGSLRTQHVPGRTWTRYCNLAARVRMVMAVLTVAAFGSIVSTASAQAAARSIHVTFTNNSDSVLTLTYAPVEGEWKPPPPNQIQIGQTVEFEGESNGVLTGTEFYANYKLADGSPLELFYDDPFVGSNSYREVAPQGYVISRTGGSGNNASVTQTFGCNSTVCDGIPDEWKEKGVTIDPGGGNPPQFIDLPHMGVSLDRPTVMVQLDWMKDATHNQALRQAAIDNGIKAFNEDPVTYRGATRSGITLIVDAGPNSTITPGGATWGALSRAQVIPWTKDLLTGNRKEGFKLENFYTLLKNNFVLTGRLPIFHYGVVAAEIANEDSTSGLTPGTKLGFMVTLGDWEGSIGSEHQQNGTFMHEFGHTLGLQHGGLDGGNYKPNYPSIMNYLFQMEGVPLSNGTRVWDYSRDTEPELNEATLTEAGGVNLGSNASGYGTGHACFKGEGENPEAFTQSTLAPVNWTCTGKPAPGTGFDANGDGKIEVLKGATSDWSRLDFKTGGVGAGAGAKETVTIPSSGTSAPSESDVTTQIQSRIRSLPLSTKVTYTSASAGDYHDPITVSATLVDPGASNAPIAERSISFQLGSVPSDSCSALTDSNGTASCTITPTQAPGSYSLMASFAGDSTYQAGSDTQSFTIKQEESKLAYTGETTADYHDAFTASATLVDPDGGAPIAGKPIKFTLGVGDTCTATTDGFGNASCSITPTQAAGAYTITASFGPDTHYLSSSDTKPFTITKEQTTTTYTGPTVILEGASGVTLKGQLFEDGVTPISGRTLTLSLGAQNCTGTTDANGVASCTLTFTGPLGSEPLVASFAGDAYYLPSSDTSKTAIVFSFPSRGAFVLGDDSAAVPITTVAWWADDWSTENNLSGGFAPPAFKGFAATVALPTSTPPAACAGPWTSRPGNSSSPPASVPSYMGVLVSSSITKSGSTISGNTTNIVVMKTEPGYAPDPGHHGTGTIVASYC